MATIAAIDNLVSDCRFEVSLFLIALFPLSFFSTVSNCNDAFISQCEDRRDESNSKVGHVTDSSESTMTGAIRAMETELGVSGVLFLQLQHS